jgi:hypothetical protein
MSLTDWFGFRIGATNTELPDIYPMSLLETDFVQTNTENIYIKILTDTFERTHGLAEDFQDALFDNCLQSEANKGLITLLACAMTKKSDLFLVYDRALKVLREADSAEREQIRTDYASRGESKVGIFISFRNYRRSDMIKLYSALEYCTISSLNKSSRLSTAIQVKMSDLRGSVSLSDSSEVKSQAKSIACALAQGKDVLLDAKDTIETAVPDLTSVQTAIEFITQKKCFYLGLPASYLTGQQPKGLGDSGEGDAKAVERGLKNYYFSIVKPVLTALFGATTNFKSQDFRQIESAMNALKTFSLVGDELISEENMTMIINKLLDLDDDAEGSGLKPDPVPVVVSPGQKPSQVPPKNA